MVHGGWVGGTPCPIGHLWVMGPYLLLHTLGTLAVLSTLDMLYVLYRPYPPVPVTARVTHPLRVLHVSGFTRYRGVILTVPEVCP